MVVIWCWMRVCLLFGGLGLCCCVWLCFVLVGVLSLGFVWVGLGFVMCLVF